MGRIGLTRLRHILTRRDLIEGLNDRGAPARIRPTLGETASIRYLVLGFERGHPRALQLTHKESMVSVPRKGAGDDPSSIQDFNGDCRS